MPGVLIITSLPRFVSQEEHRELTSSTPASFSEIPAVLYYQEQNASITLDPPLDGMTEQDCANGIVYVLSSHLIFWSATGKGLQVTYPTISLHAISRAELGPSIYCQLDETLDGEDEPTPDEEDAMEMRELRLNVQSEASLEPLFEALSQCAALHPDEDNGEEDEFDDAFLDADEMGDGDFVTEEQGELSEAGRVRTNLPNARYNPY
ncbi:SubName: Full=Uncharacterized protein {ECO:0000313/EMBL:KIM27556.1} [Serendipita indica DSM 11827]|nr:SubName: Full=Uncharacterized protein {ECO:0000313/EMBL:KIM27556.1} [Serendipita indica DSM 11827]